MSSTFMLDPTREAFLSAGLRHLRDAEHLAQVAPPDRSLDQAYHLAGFAPECARKATIAATFHVAIGHGVQPASETALRMALAHDPVAHRYEVLDWNARYPALAAWTESARYEQTGTRKAVEVEKLLGEARDAVDRIVLALWADGRIKASFAW